MIKMIDSYDKLPLGLYGKICEITGKKADGSVSTELERQVQVISLLSGMTENEIYSLPVSEYTEAVRRMLYLSTDIRNRKKVASSYRIGGMELVPELDVRKMTVAQYVDYQTYAKDSDKAELELSCFLIPKGHKYGEGYDVADVQRTIADCLPMTDAVTLVAFFLRKCISSMKATRTYSAMAMRMTKDRTKREAIARETKRLTESLRAAGDGLRQLMR